MDKSSNEKHASPPGSGDAKNQMILSSLNKEDKESAHKDDNKKSSQSKDQSIFQLSQTNPTKDTIKIKQFFEQNQASQENAVGEGISSLELQLKNKSLHNLTEDDLNLLISQIDVCQTQANLYIGNLTEENDELKSRLESVSQENEMLRIELQNREAQMLEFQTQLQQQFQMQQQSKSEQKNEEIQHFLSIIENLNNENKQLKSENEILRIENQKAIQIASQAKNNRLFKEINNKIDQLNQSLTYKQDSPKQANPGANVNDTTQNLTINHINANQGNNSFIDNSFKKDLQKINSDFQKKLNQTINLENLNTTQTNPSNQKKTYKFIKPRK